MMERLITVHSAAKYLSLSPQTIYNLVKHNDIPFVRIGRAVRIDKTVLDELLNKESNQDA
jgi:excisionase family DNA binding protein